VLPSSKVFQYVLLWSAISITHTPFFINAKKFTRFSNLAQQNTFHKYNWPYSIVLIH
jgi:hypothetical protein